MPRPRKPRAPRPASSKASPEELDAWKKLAAAVGEKAAAAKAGR